MTLTYTITEVAIHPWFLDEDGDQVPESEAEEGQEPDSWNVHSFGVDENGQNDIFDDDDFDDYETAMAHAKKLAKKYDVEIDHRY